MTSLNGESPTTPHSATSPTQPSISAPNGTSPARGDKSASTPSNGNPGTSLNPRSCTTCRKRKVRCDKKHPCANCSKANIECIFPGPGRAPRRSRKPPDTELLARLRRLEGVVQSLGKGLEDDGVAVEPGLGPGPGLEVELPKLPEKDDGGGNKTGCPVARDGGFFGLHSANRDVQRSEKMVKEFGRLKVEGGRSRYVSNKFWVGLSEEVAEMRDILDDPTDDEDDYPSPGSGSAASANHQGYLFNYRSIAHSLRNFHPPDSLITTYWRIFKENVDPLIKIFHRPSTEKVFCQAAHNLDHISKPMEVMMFAIYFAVVTSLSEVECISVLGIEKQAALETYRFGFEQAMARADFLCTQELVVLQSFVLFLTCVRRFDDSRYAWTLTGLVIRMAQALGVHRDGQVFGLSPFETEMRRRLWWQICNLDMRASEDHGSDPSIVEQTFDTKFPLNINDDDISPEMTEPPEEKEGRTEMLFDLIRFTVSTTVRRLSYAPPGPGPCREKIARITLEDKERLIEELHQYLEKKYLKYCDMSVPLDWVAATVSRLILAKMWLIVHHPFAREDGGAGLPQETKDRLFLTSIEVIEFSRLLETETTTLKWGWLFRTYVQWHAVAFVLSQLCVRTTGPEVEKAWTTVDSVFDEWGGVVSASKRGMLWKPLRKLMNRAKAAREREVEKQLRFPLDGSLGPVSNKQLNVVNGRRSSSKTLNGTTLHSSASLNNANNPADDFTPLIGSQPLSMSNGPPPLNPHDLYPPTHNGVSEIPPGSLPIGDEGENTLPVDEWAFEDGLLPPNVFSGAGGGGDEGMDWVGWDYMVQDFSMEVENGQGVERGARGGRVINWW